jgi:hypothetical protein
MDARPEPPPEGVLISAALENSGISKREAARRAGISEGRWRQIVTGSQSLGGGSYGIVRGAPAKTVARMALAVGVAPEDMAGEGQRSDVAREMGTLRNVPQTRAAAPPACDPAAGPDPLARFSPQMRDLMRPHLAAIAVRVESARRARAAAGRDPDETPAGAEIFPDSPQDALSWDRLARRLPGMDDLLPVMLAELLALEELRDDRQHQDDEAPGSALRRG